MALQLHITKPEGDTKYDNELRPIGDVVTFGRRPDNDVVLDDGERQISGRHAKFEYKAGTWFVTDLESRNGTFLDERRLPPHQPAVLHSGSIVQIGLLHIEVALDQSNSDLGRTLVSRDPKRSAAILGERLCDVYAKLRGASPATRNAEMRAAIARVLADSDPTQARVVLSIVRQRYASGCSAPATRRCRTSPTTCCIAPTSPPRSRSASSCG
jgi:predicted component of type VI protein secretion system